MSIIYTKQTYTKNSETSHTVIHECFEASLKPNEVALAALLTAQGSAVVLSFLFPNQGYIVQTGVLTCAFLLFCKIQHLNAKKHTELKIIIPKSPLALKKTPRPPTPIPREILSPIGTIRTAPLSLDDRLEALTNDLIRLKFWQIIPHPYLGGPKE